MSSVVNQKPMFLGENKASAEGPCHLLSDFRGSRIPEMVRQFHCRDEKPSMIPIMLQENEVTRFRLDFRNGEQWWLHVPAHLYYKKPEDILSIVKAEAGLIWSYNRRGDPSAPRIIMSSPSFKNEICFPFILVTYDHERPSEARTLQEAALNNEFYGVRHDSYHTDRRYVQNHRILASAKLCRDCCSPRILQTFAG